MDGGQWRRRSGFLPLCTVSGNSPWVQCTRERRGSIGFIWSADYLSLVLESAMLGESDVSGQYTNEARHLSVVSFTSFS